jgi:hypothetical protein
VPKRGYDWLEPWWHLLQLVTILLQDAAGIILIVALARLVENIIGQISTHPLEWQFWIITISLSEIISYGDLFVVVVFFYVAFRHIIKWAKQ